MLYIAFLHHTPKCTFGSYICNKKWTSWTGLSVCKYKQDFHFYQVEFVKSLWNQLNQWHSIILPYSSGTMIPNRPSSFSPFKVSGGILASWSIFAESTESTIKKQINLKKIELFRSNNIGASYMFLIALVALLSCIHQIFLHTFLIKEFFHWCDKLIDLF